MESKWNRNAPFAVGYVDFIRGEAAEQIMDLKLRSVSKNLEKEKGIKLEIGDDYRNYLLRKARADLSNGGRGISNLVETSLVNPLANILVQENWKAGDSILIKGPDERSGGLDFEIGRA